MARRKSVLKRLVATCVIGLSACPALAQHQMDREETIAQVATDVAFIEETLPSYKISSGEGAISMDFVELHRWFAPISKDQELNPDYGTHWGARLSGWLDWSGLLQRRRVVVLAEAASGKSEEFRNQARQLSVQRKPSFYLRIEELADQGF